MTDLILGIDPGVKGAFAMLSRDGGIVKVWQMPNTGSKIDFRGVHEFFRDMADWVEESSKTILVSSEKPFAFMPDKKAQGTVAMLNYGIGFGVVLGSAMQLGCAIQQHSPKTWQAKMFKGTDARCKPKEKAYQAAKMIWHDIDEHAMVFPRAKRPHDGIIDACLIAEFGRRECA